jgi:glyoxylase-like metal-dependent hydrolase (beta-lactamase superfamily II)
MKTVTGKKTVPSRKASASQSKASAKTADGLTTPFGEPQAGELYALSEDVWQIANSMPFAPFSQNAYAFADHFDGRDCWTIIDPGMRSSEAFWQKLLSDQLSALPVGRVIATHYHPDHIGLAGWMQSAFGAALWTTRTSWLFARMLQLDAWDTPPEEAIMYYRLAGYDEAMLARFNKRSRFNFSVIVAPMPLGFHRIGAGDIIKIGHRMFKVAIGNGHAPEHAVLISETDDMVIAGDQILPRISPNIGVYPTEPNADPLGEWIESCRRFARLLRKDQLILPGHGPVFRGAPRRLRKMVSLHEDRLNDLEAHLGTPRRVVDCFSALFRREIDGMAEGLATVETIAHLNRLEASGRAQRERQDNVEFWRRT